MIRMVLANLFDTIPADLPDELIDTLVGTDSFRLERIVSRGHVTEEGEWYDQNRDEWVVLLRGAARLRFQDPDDDIQLKPGDHLLIAAHHRHRVEWTAPDQETVWLALHFDSTPNERD